VRISSVLESIDSGRMALPEFQRGYVWNRDQVRGLFHSLYRRHPVGGLLVWVTESKGAAHRGDAQIAPGVVNLLLDGQQRITTLYGVVRGMPPKFFDGNAQAFSGLRFHLENETFEFYQPQRMQNDPLWIDLTELMRKGTDGLGEYIARLSQDPGLTAHLGKYFGRLGQLLGMVEVDLHVEEVTGADKSLDMVVDIFNLVNSGGTKLSKGDLALAKICAEWPEARQIMQQALRVWAGSGYHFKLDWLLRSVNTVLTGEAKFTYLYDKTADEMRAGLHKAVKRIDAALNLIAGRLGLDQDAVLFGRFAFPVMVRYLDQHSGPLNETEQDKLLFWYAQAGMWGRFSGSTETLIDQDLASLVGEGDPLDRLLERLRLWHGGLRVEGGHFSGWSLGARFYPILYLLTRMGGAEDWVTGQALKLDMLGRMNRLELHHIFPKALLYRLKYARSEANALANFCFLTKESNLMISDRMPEEYFPKYELLHPGTLASQWIPMDEYLWKAENYLDFLAARRELLAAATNLRMGELLHGDRHWLDGPASPVPATVVAIGGIVDDDEEDTLTNLNDWIEGKGLPRGQLAYDFTDPDTGEPRAVFDLAWPDGVQEGLSQPVAVLLNEDAQILALATGAGFRCFTGVVGFKAYLARDVLEEVQAA